MSRYDMPGSQGLVLHHPMECRGAIVFGAARNVGGLFNEEQIQLIAERRFVPIEPFAYWLKKGQLHDDLFALRRHLATAKSRMLEIANMVAESCQFRNRVGCRLRLLVTFSPHRDGYLINHVEDVSARPSLCGDALCAVHLK
ncbi:MAG: hypothetical protein ACT4OT_08965 [Acidobacteriota bacterium]